VAVQSKLTVQGQISVPAEVRRRLGLGPGSILEWSERDGAYLVRRAGRYTCADIHDALFAGVDLAAIPTIDVKQSIRSAVQRRHARR
jgi:AbrB family looped-hinge helix DNA binding protein